MLKKLIKYLLKGVKTQYFLFPMYDTFIYKSVKLYHIIGLNKR